MSSRQGRALPVVGSACEDGTLPAASELAQGRGLPVASELAKVLAPSVSPAWWFPALTGDANLSAVTVRDGLPREKPARDEAGGRAIQIGLRP